ncbi:MAG TPA: glycosyltransferase [Ktedonobacteraceae bacterium]|jgi:UDP-N-acetylglucosamine:LPS N-acetylglucosamine transferase
MSNQPKILILTSRTGGGHISLADALNDQLANSYTTEIIDPQPHFIHLHYRLVSRYALWLWAAEFRWLDTPKRSLMFHRASTLVMTKGLAAVLDRVRPNLIITTYPFLTYEVTSALRSLGMHTPLALLFADPNGVHASWLTEQQAFALAPTRETYAQALAVGFDPARVHLIGWPVRKQFYEVDDTQHTATLSDLGLDPERFTIFLQGGGEGAARFSRTVEHVLATQARLQVILATGTNQKLLARFKNVPHVHALPFVKNVAPLMAASDVVMGKAGPNVLFEAVALGKPLIATAYIPGQEHANLEFIRRHQLGWVALHSDQQQLLLKNLAETPSELEAMRSSVARYREWNTSAYQHLLPIIKKLI